MAPRVLELVYTAWDMKPFAEEDMGYRGEPYRWDEERRAHLRAELDAYYARLYGLTRDELRYVLDPKDAVGGDGFPGETFRVLKEKEIKQYGDASQSDAAVGRRWRSGMGYKAKDKRKKAKVKMLGRKKKTRDSARVEKQFR